MQRLQNEAQQQKVNKADETAKWNNSFRDSYFYWVTENKNKLYGGATTKIEKNIKVRGLYILNNKTVSFTIRVNTGLSLGFCLELCVN
jgi:hypothetical protein